MRHDGTINLAEVDRARRSLAGIAARHPGLLGQSPTETRVEDWVRILNSIEEVVSMGKTNQIGVRFPPEIVELIDRFAEETTEELRDKHGLPGLEINRAGAIRILVEKALQDRGYTATASEGPKKGVRKQDPK